MTEPQSPEASVPEISLEIPRTDSKDEVLRKKLILGGVMLTVLIVCTLIANVK